MMTTLNANHRKITRFECKTKYLTHQHNLTSDYNTD